jgi:allantoicase
MLECCHLPAATADALTDSSLRWTELVPRAKLQPHARHQFQAQPITAATHVRLNIYPDGGVARLRLLGRRADASPQ